MKVIFLDIDGVLNEENWMLNNTPWIDENKLKLLSNLCRKTKSKIVLSTNWREIWFEPMYINSEGNCINLAHKLFKKYKLDVIGVTPSLGMRESEILTYLSDNDCDNDFDNYVVFDDNKLNLSHFIQTDKSKGLTEDDCVNALSILSTCS